MIKLFWKTLNIFALTFLTTMPSTGFAAIPENALSLQDCIRQALQTNEAIKIAANNKEKASWTVREAQGAKGITFSLIHKETRLNPLLANGAGDDKYTNNFANQMAMSLPIYTGSKLEGQISQARHNATIASLSLDVARHQLLFDTTVAYFTLLQYQDALRVSQQTVEDYTEHLNIARSKYDTGLVAKSDVLQTQVKLANAQDSLIIARTNYVNAAAALNNLIGHPQGQEVKLKEQLSYEPVIVTLDEAIQQALTRRPEVIQARAGIASAGDQITVAKSGRLPSVLASATNNWYADKLPGSDNRNWQISLTASMNLFDSGVVNSQIRQAEYDLATAKEHEHQIREAVELEVRQQYHSLREAESRIELSKIAVNQAEEDLVIYKTRYEAGVGINLEVMDAAVSLAAAKNNAIKALYDYNISKARLEKAIGIAIAE